MEFYSIYRIRREKILTTFIKFSKTQAINENLKEECDNRGWENRVKDFDFYRELFKSLYTTKLRIS